MNQNDTQTLALMPHFDRQVLLEDVVIGQCKRHLVMGDGEEISLQQNYFDLGLTSLQLVEIKEHLEETFACVINTSEIFEKPTVEQLVEHLDTLLTQKASRTA